MFSRIPLLVVFALIAFPVCAQERKEKLKKPAKVRVERADREGDAEVQAMKKRFIELQKSGADKEELIELRNEIFQRLNKREDGDHKTDHDRDEDHEMHDHDDHGHDEHEGDEHHEHERDMHRHEDGDHEHGDHEHAEEHEHGQAERMEHLHIAIRHLHEAGMPDLAQQVIRQVERIERAQHGERLRERPFGNTRRPREQGPVNERAFMELRERVNMLQREMERMQRFIREEIEEDEDYEEEMRDRERERRTRE